MLLKGIKLLNVEGGVEWFGKVSIRRNRKILLACI
jgi:hypothetical protein